MTGRVIDGMLLVGLWPGVAGGRLMAGSESLAL